MSVPCPSCGRENPDGFAFCGHCGAALASDPAEPEVRKTVTVVFSDVSDSTAMGERLDPEPLRRVMTRYFDEMQSVLERHGGTVEKFIGDAVMAVFGVPRVHEDDALRAVRAAAEMRERLVALNKELERDHGVTIANRTGVNTGEVVSADQPDGQRLVTGDAVNVAARLEQSSPPGGIVLGETTFRLVRDAVEAEQLEPLAVKGKSQPIRAWRLVAVIEGAEQIARHLDAPMVGRERELRTVVDAFERAENDSACALITILGAPGVGKSRLVEEFVDAVGERATVLRGRCLPYGDGITYWPVVEMFDQLIGAHELAGPEEIRKALAALIDGSPEASAVAERVGQLFGLADAVGAPEETPWAVRKVLEGIARRRPVLVIVDDLHWAEPALLDLVEHVADWSRDAAILLVCTARPELLDGRPDWGGGKVNATTFLLEPLTVDQSA